jgi:hypothetical protein
MTRVASHRSRLIAGLVMGFASVAGSSAWAQPSGCQDSSKFLSERKSLAEQLNGLSKGGKISDARAACGLLTKLVTNGETGVKWIEANKDWCQIPDQFAQGFKEEHSRAVSLKGKACQVAAQQAAMEKRAKAQAQQQSGPGLLGGGGLTGQYKIPQGAL